MDMMKQKEVQQKENEQQMKLYNDDKASIDYYSKAGASFQYSSDKNLMRNYRDYTISRELVKQDNFKDDIYKESTEHINIRERMCSGMDKSLPMPSMELPQEVKSLEFPQCLKNLCSCKLLQKDLDNKTIINLTEHLTAGKYMVDQTTDFNRIQNEEMQQQGMEALREIYLRMLDALGEKYGDKISKYTAYDYIKKLPEIENDFASLEDMKVFFAYYKTEVNSEREQILRKRLVYYAETFSIIKERSDAIISGRKEELTDKGTLKKDVEKNYAKRLIEARKHAIQEKAFKTQKEKNSLSEYFSKTEKRKEKATIALLNIQINAGDEVIKSIEDDNLLADVQEKLVQYHGANMIRDILNNEKSSAYAREQARKKLEQYEKSSYYITPEEAEVLINRRNEVKEDLSVVPGVVSDITEDNFFDVAAEQKKNIKNLCAFIEKSNDEQMIAGGERGIALGKCVYSQQLMMEYSFLGQWNVSVNEHESRIRTLEEQEYQKRKRYIDEYRQVRQEYEEASKVIRRCEKIVNNRLDNIRLYGCTQTYHIEDESSPMEEMKRLKGTEQSTDSKEVYYNEARKVKPVETIFTLSEDGKATTSLSQMKTMYLSMKKVEEMKQAQPDYYRLGQSYDDFLSCERLVSLLPSFEKAYLLFLKLNMLDERNDTIQEELQNQFYSANIEYVTKFQEWRNHLLNGKKVPTYKEETNVLLQEKLDKTGKDLISKYEEIRKDEDLVKELGADSIDDLYYSRALVFIDTEKAETKKKDIAVLSPLMKYSTMYVTHSRQDWDKETENQKPMEQPDEEVLSSALKLIHRFSKAYNQCISTLGQGTSPFSDSLLIDNYQMLEKCQIMGTAIRTLILETKLMDTLKKTVKETEFSEMSQLEVDSYEERLKDIMGLSSYATSLALYEAERNGVIEARFTQSGAFTPMTSTQMLDAADVMKQEGTNCVIKHRVAKKVEENADELREIELVKRVRSEVGRELTASARKGKWQTIRYGLEWVGNRIGKPLQFLSWILHDQRTNKHGEVCYDKCKELYNQRIQNKTEIKESTLPLWQRGDGYAPEIDLDRYFGSPLKKRIHQMLTDSRNAGTMNPSENDVLAEEFSKAVEAASMYCNVVGVVNTDTTEMEMAFLDQFQKIAGKYKEMHQGTKDDLIERKLTLLTQIEKELGTALSGTLDRTISDRELTLINESTTAYVEDTCYLPNMTESNIKDIPLFLHEPTINDVRQSSIGDCWLVSAIGTITKTNPDFIRSMFHDCGDGNVIVRLYAAEDVEGKQLDFKGKLTQPGVTMKPAYFKLRKHYETGWGNAADCTWVQLLEKAYALGGFNTRNSVEVRGNRLYNVADELTMGDIPFAMAHLMGKLPARMEYNVGIAEEHFLKQPMLDGLMAGIDKRIVNYAKVYLENYTNEVSEQTVQDKRKNSIETILGIIDKSGEFIVRGSHDNKDGELTPENIQTAILDLRNKVLSNFEKMRKGEPLDFGNAEVNKKQYVSDEEHSSAIQIRKKMCEYFDRARTDTIKEYKQSAIDFYHRCERIFEEGGAVSIAIPHCVSIIDAKEHQGKLFLLMRDPFNAYNTVYTQKDGKRVSEEEAFMSVIEYNDENRHIPEEQQKFLKASFRGTSWVELDELHSKLTAANAMRREDLQ